MALDVVLNGSRRRGAVRKRARYSSSSTRGRETGGGGAAHHPGNQPHRARGVSANGLVYGRTDGKGLPEVERQDGQAQFQLTGRNRPDWNLQHRFSPYRVRAELQGR